MDPCAGAEQVRSKALCQTPRYTSIKSFMPLANLFSSKMIGAIGLVKVPVSSAFPVGAFPFLPPQE